MLAHRAAALVALTLPLPAQAMSEADFQAIAARAFAPVIAEYAVPGLAVGVTWKGQEFVYTTGLADRAARKPVTPETLFELGSLSKTLNVALATTAEAEGRLSLADPVADHIADLRGTAFGKLTLMDLATHQTGGLPLQVPDTVDDEAGLIRWLHDWRPKQPDVRSYSNISIGLLGTISADAYGTSYPEALAAHILRPLALDSIYFTVPADAAGRYAFGYDRKTGAPIRVNPGVLDVEAYGLKSSVTDMLTLLRANLAPAETPIGAALLKTQAGQTRTPQFDQAMVWERYPWPVTRDQLLAGNAPAMITEGVPATRLPQPDANREGVLFGKTGSTNGFGGYLAFIPSEDFGIVVLANRNVPLPARARAALEVIEGVLEAAD